MSRTVSVSTNEDDNDQTRPDQCSCRATETDLPCWECYFAGFDRPAEWSVEVGDRVRADWSEGEGSYDEIVGVVVDTADDLITVDVDQDDECEGGDEIRFGKHDCSPEWVDEIVEVNVYDTSDLDGEDDGDMGGPEDLIGENAETVPEEELDDATFRALDASRPLDVWKIAPKMYCVESENESYTVDLKEERCTCEGYMYHGHCRHLRRVKIMTGEYRLPAHTEHLEMEVDPSMGSHMEEQIKVE